MNRYGALAGMLVGHISVLVWEQLEGGPYAVFQLYEIISGFLFSSLAIIVFSLMTTPPGPGILCQFEAQ